MIFQHKTCSECGRELPATLDHFHKDKRIRSGLKAACKDCSNARLNKLRKEHPEAIKQYTQKYYVSRRELISKRNAEWMRRNPDKKAEMCRRYQENNPDHLKAQASVHYAVKIGKMPHPKTLLCVHKAEGCRVKASEYHHCLGYSPEHWLDVIPVCARCHRKLDRKRER